MNFQEAKTVIIETGREIHARGWVPATSGNFSLRLDDGSIAITVSGKDKSRLDESGLMRVDGQGRALEDKKASAEALLHLSLYRRDQDIGAVAHTHSLNAALVSMQPSTVVRVSGLELLKAFRGTESHENSLDIPVFGNNQNIRALADEVEAHMQGNGQGHAYLIRGHGIYTWGRDMHECMRHLEALEFLLDYHRQSTQIRREHE